MSAGRDLVGYGKYPPDPRWPRAARLAINVVINVEEGSEPSVPDGDPASESALTELGAQRSDVEGRDLAAESMFEYGSRVGIWRLLRLLEERGLPCTIFGCALALERHPELAGEIARLGHDVCSHGFRWERHYRLDPDTERKRIERAVASIERTTGERPLGWYCRYGPSLATRELLAAEGGFLYDSDSYADELPYWVEAGGRPHLVVPYSLATNDTKFVRGGMATGGQLFVFLRDSVSMLLGESPRMLSIGLHSRLTGHPARASGLARFLDWLAGDERIWFARRVEIARHWHTHHPPGEGR